jgi:hypothetical protein
MPIKLSTTKHGKSHRFSLRHLPIFYYYIIAHRAAPTSHSMAGEADQALHVANKPAADEGKSDTAMTSSSATLAIIKMADKIVPNMTDYWKKSTITEKEHQAYHDFGWLAGNLISTVPDVDIPTMHDSTSLL